MRAHSSHFLRAALSLVSSIRPSGRLSVRVPSLPSLARMSSSVWSSELMLADVALSPPPDRLLYWLLQFCSFDGLSACRSELRALLFDASERQLQSDVDRVLSRRGGSGDSSGNGSASSARAELYEQLSASRDTAMAAVDVEVTLRVKLRALYRSVVECSYSHAMGLSTWLAELRHECDSAGLALTASSAFFRLQLAAIGNMAVRAADRPRTTKAEFDRVMKHLLTYAAVTDGSDTAHTTQHTNTLAARRQTDETHRVAAEECTLSEP